MGGLGPSVTAIPRVPLGPGQVASAIVEGTDNPIGAQTSCPYYPYLLVTPPSLTEHVQLTVFGLGTQPGYVGFPGCSEIEVHPVVPGSKGTYQF
jgi:hypothetical protein